MPPMKAPAEPGMVVARMRGTKRPRVMPARIISLAVVLFLTCTTVSAQTSQPAEAEHKDIGKVKPGAGATIGL